jgi:hypothetical protein
MSLHFWVAIYDLFNISRRISSAYYPETDREPERVYQTIEQYLYTLPNFGYDK